MIIICKEQLKQGLFYVNFGGGDTFLEKKKVSLKRKKNCKLNNLKQKAAQIRPQLTEF